VITHKVYVLDTNQKDLRKGISVLLNTGIVMPKSTVENMSFSPGPSISLSINYVKVANNFKLGMGFGMGQYELKSKTTSFTKIEYESKSIVTEIVERYFKVRGNDTIWFNLTEDREKLTPAESLLVQEKLDKVQYLFLQIPVSVGYELYFGKFLIEPGIDLDTRWVWRRNNSSINILAGLHLCTEYIKKERLRLGLKLTYLKDIRSVSGEFKSQYLQFGFYSTFIW